MNQSFSIPCGLVHLEWFAPRACVIRLFLHPLGEIDATTGQPQKRFDWCATGHHTERTMWIKGVLLLPRLSIVLQLIAAARRVDGVESVKWEKWNGPQRKITTAVRNSSDL